MSNALVRLLRSAFVALLSLPGCSYFFESKTTKDGAMQDQSIHSIEYTTLEGKKASFQDYKGKVVLVVNVASECGFTPQYEGLEKLYEELSPKGFVVIGFPSNEFGGQEPGDAAQIQTFCSTKYGVKFPLAAKIETKVGPTQSPVYKFLGGATGSLPKWNFGKYLIGKDGKVVAFYASNVTPESAELRKAIDIALGA